MPVSTFSPDHTARSRGGLIQRWNSTQDRINADERRRGMSEMQELDGIGLYDRPDWPLASSPTEPDSQQRVKVLQQDGRAELEQELVEEAAVVRSVEDLNMPMDSPTYTTEHDVSDFDASDDDDIDHPGPLETLRTPQPLRREEAVQNPTPFRAAHRDLESPPHHTHAEVSPIRSDQASQARVSPSIAPQPEIEEPEERPSPEVNGQEMDVEDDDDLGELRDIATPIPLGPNTPEQQQGTFSPRVNGHAYTNSTPTSNGSNFRSSISKGPMNTPPQRRTSTRNSFYNTTQIAHPKDRVRYSWQSAQDDEPNRPRIHVIKLVSNTATASAGFPTGEAFGFSISPGGRRIAVYNSARLYVLQTAALPVGITQDYALKRRPLAVELVDEGTTIAILADDHTINVYELGHVLKRTRTIKLDFPTSTIALAPTGGLLAAAYEGGIEVFSLHPEATPSDRRAVRCVKMDRISFSEDGSTLLGTTTRINASSTVVVSVPVFPSQANGLPTHEELREAWCSELLHPENIRNSSHATFMREDRKTTNERLFAWNGLEDTFGILNVADMQYGTIDFPVVISPPLSTCGGLGAAIHSCPAMDEHGDTVAMIVNDRTIRLYIVPHKADEDATSVEAHSIDHELDEGYGCPFSEARWVYSSASLPAPLDNKTAVKGRLIVTSPGGVTENGISEESVEEIEGGRIILFDFDPQFAGQPGVTFNLTLGKSPPQMLEEEQIDVSEAISLVRRRTVNQNRSNALNARPATLGRSATMHGNRNNRGMSPAISAAGMSRSRNSMLSIGSLQSDAARSLPDLQESNEAIEAFEEPYVQGAPRSQASLQRAASNAQRHRFQTLEERQQERVSVDSSGHFLPLPEYTEEPNAPLPSRFRAMAGLDAPAVFNRPKPAVVTTVNGNANAPSPSSSSSATPRTAPPDIGENFSADLAFRAATANLAAGHPMTTETIIEEPRNSTLLQSPVSTPTSIPSSMQRNSHYGAFEPHPASRDAPNPPTRTGTFDARTDTFTRVGPPGRQGTFDSLSSLPRSLQRAYSNANAVSPIANYAPPSLNGDWNNAVSPIVQPPSSLHEQTSVSGAPPSEAWDVISPVASNDTHATFARTPNGANPYRYSTSLLNPPGHMPPPRASTSSGGSSATVPGMTTHSAARRMPPHMQAFRNAAAANASASLFPPTQPSNHVPLRQPKSNASSVAHPITAWHPPAASTSHPPGSSYGSVRRSHSRKSSLAGKSAFPSTAKAKRLGFFKKSRKPDPFTPMYGRDNYENSSMMETKSMMTWMTKSDSKCAVM
ncbi:hypothetical protein HII31_07492 [Pseudocercospora fuligena]|uniref:DUF7165 domain-containing protein n=1 Tax=Pseudocercospora fuligena TaxID=685502 RepID=A0A8H6RHY2_9PEZI|nr:hypothetical protein HII31_07492 [Pseudocercospora fuligena]